MFVLPLLSTSILPVVGLVVYAVGRSHKALNRNKPHLLSFEVSRRSCSESKDSTDCAVMAHLSPGMLVEIRLVCETNRWSVERFRPLILVIAEHASKYLRHH